MICQLHQQDHLVDMTALHKINVEGAPLVNHLPLHPLLGTPRLPVCLLSLVG